MHGATALTLRAEVAQHERVRLVNDYSVFGEHSDHSGPQIQHRVTTGTEDDMAKKLALTR